MNEGEAPAVAAADSESHGAIRSLIVRGRLQGYLIRSEAIAMLPVGLSAQGVHDDILNILSDMGIPVVDEVPTAAELTAMQALLIIPAHGGRGFQSNVDTDSSRSWTDFQDDRGQFSSCRGMAVTMPCRHREHDCDDDESPARTGLRVRPAARKHHVVQVDTMSQEKERTPSMFKRPAAG